jgi:hypothetical protein
MSPERVVVKEVPFEVEVTREVPVPVERVIYKEVLVRISIHIFLKYLIPQHGSIKLILEVFEYPNQLCEYIRNHSSLIL